MKKENKEERIYLRITKTKKNEILFAKGNLTYAEYILNLIEKDLKDRGIN